MNLIQKVRSIWEGSSLTKKGKLCLSLTAIGIMGGFFATQVYVRAMADPLPVTSPKIANSIPVVWGGTHSISWNIANCQGSGMMDIALISSEQSNIGISSGTVACSAGTYSWNTAETVTVDSPVRKYADGAYKIFILQAGTGATIFGTSDSFTIDNTAPTITVGTLISPNGGELWGGATRSITWNAGDITDTNLGSNPISLSYLIDGSTSWISVASGLAITGPYSWALPSVNSEAVKVKITATDLAGNISSDESNEVFKIDATKPTATVAVNAGTVNEGNLIKTVTVTYLETMSVSPTITFNTTGFTSNDDGFWNTGNTIWTESFATTDLNQEVASVTATAKNAQDAAGNVQSPDAVSNSFAIDTLNPTVASATATPSPAKADLTSVKVVFSENMETNICPTVQITGLTGGSITVTKTAYTDKTWTGSFIVLTNAGNATATISVTGAKDVVGNVMADNATAGTFKIDTVNPTGSVALTSLKVNDGDLIQTVTVTYLEAMSVAPSIVFNKGTWTNEVGEGWSGDKMAWKQSFKVNDLGEEISGITATASGAQDLAGNVQVVAAVSSAFAIDTKNPTMVLSSGHADNIVKNSNGFYITATFTETNGIDEVDVPKITIGNIISAATMEKDGNNNLAWRYHWDVPTGNDGTVNVSISAKDTFGNLNSAATGINSYIIDNTKPAVALTYDPNRMVRDADTLKITVTFTEAVIATPTIAIDLAGSTDLGVTAMTGSGSVWTYNLDVPAGAGNDGVATVTIVGSDIAGNASAVATNNKFTIDNTAPTIGGFTAPVANKVYKNGVDLVFTATDANLDKCSYKIDGVGEATPVSCTSGVSSVSTVAIPADGVHTIVVTVVDKATNSASSTPVSFIVDTNNTLTVGATGAEFTTINGAIAAASNGDTISVAAGDYPESISIPANKTGLKILKDGSTGTATIKATTGDAITIPAGAINTEIKGFTIDCNGRDYGIKTTGATGVKIENNIISGYGKNGVIVNGGEITIDGNTITGSTSSVFSVDSIYSTGATLTITNNTLKNNVYSPNITSTSAGISLHHNDNATITGNTIYGNSYGIHVKGASSAEGANPMLITAHENKIYDNVTLNFFFEYRGVVPASNYDVTHNWWGSKVKSAIVSKIATREEDKTELYATNYVNYSPWYLSGDSFVSTNLSNSDTTKPVVTLSTNDADGIVKTGDAVTLTATITDANGIDGIPQITITNGQMATGIPTTLTASMTSVSADTWKFDWTAPAIDTSNGNVTAGISVKAYDGVGNDNTGTASLTIDNSAPATPAITSFTTPINLGNQMAVQFAGSGEVGTTVNWEIKDSSTGKVSGTIAANDNSGSFTVALINVSTLIDGNLTLSVILADKGGLTSIVAGTATTVKNTSAPILAEVTPVVTPGTIISPIYVFSSTEAGTATYTGTCFSATTESVISGDNTVTFATLADGAYGDCTIKVTDVAGNDSNVLVVSNFVIDTTAPVISLSPVNHSEVSVSNPEIKAVFSENASGINVGSISVILDNFDDVTAYAHPSAEGIIYQGYNLWGGETHSRGICQR